MPFPKAGSDAAQARRAALRQSYAEHAAQAGLPVFLRYGDLVAANIVRNWPSLLRLIDEEGFPAGAMLSRNVRAWALDEVMAWLATRPTARKIVPPRRVIHEKEVA
jgi:hypothetical protein